MGILREDHEEVCVLEAGMSAGYRTELIPRWVWVMLSMSLVLAAILGFSVAMSPLPRPTTMGAEIRTGNLRDYMEAPTTQVRVTPVPSPSQAQTPTQGASSVLPAGMPKSFTVYGTKFVYSGGPMEVDVVTTGEYADDHIIYRKPSAQTPYKELFLETAPNSGQFYKYAPQQGSQKAL